MGSIQGEGLIKPLRRVAIVDVFISCEDDITKCDDYEEELTKIFAPVEMVVNERQDEFDETSTIFQGAPIHMVAYSFKRLSAFRLSEKHERRTGLPYDWYLYWRLDDIPVKPFELEAFPKSSNKSEPIIYLSYELGFLGVNDRTALIEGHQAASHYFNAFFDPKLRPPAKLVKQCSSSQCKGEWRLKYILKLGHDMFNLKVKASTCDYLLSDHVRAVQNENGTIRYFLYHCNSFGYSWWNGVRSRYITDNVYPSFYDRTRAEVMNRTCYVSEEVNERWRRFALHSIEELELHGVGQEGKYCRTRKVAGTSPCYSLLESELQRCLARRDRGPDYREDRWVVEQADKSCIMEENGRFCQIQFAKFDTNDRTG